MAIKKLTKLQLSIAIAIALVIFMTIMDLKGLAMWSILGGYNGEAFSQAEGAYMSFFWTFANAMIIFGLIMMYIWRRDLSEVLAVGAAYFLLMAGGLEDILYYWFQGMPLDQSMPWLYDNLVMGGVAKLMGLETVTPASLYTSAILMIIAAYISIKWLVKQKW